MNTAFKISPGSQQYNDMHLLAEAGNDELSFLIYSKYPFVVHGFYAYSFNKLITADDYARAVQKITDDEPVLKESFSSCNICYNGNESVLTPSSLFSEADSAGMCDLMFGANRSALCFNESVQEQDIKNVYRVHQKIYDAINNAFPKNMFHHATSLQVKKVSGNTLHCIVYHNRIKIILFKEGVLQIVRYAEYTSPADVCYHLLNVCQQFDIPVDSVALSLSGMIEQNSNLYKEIYRYFLNISFSKVADDITIEQNLKEHPDHFYSHLITLAQCV